ncbi:MAG TPA: Dabb family protein [Burkholderiaceae bacterium]|nr:Dabb family protein [Burkholderiaceae bacterium]
MAIRHLVLLRFVDGTSAAERSRIEQAFAALPAQIGGISAFEWGTDVSPEGLSKGFTHAFVVTFVDTAARDAYLPHPAHEAFVAGLKPCLAEVLVVDYVV